MFKRILHDCQRYPLFQPGMGVVVAVSGGLDSMVLLQVMRRLSASLSLSLTVAHLDHGLRHESAQDAAFVLGCCDRLALPCVTERREVQRLKQQGESVEMAARRIRYAFLREVASRVGAEKIALGHHRSDQAETLLYRLARGTGVSGLAGMAPLSEDLVRPLLGCTRTELEFWARSEGLVWREDASNTDLRYQRNRIRLEVMPPLARINPQVDQVLGGLAEQVALEEDWWRTELDRVWPDVVRWNGGVLRLRQPELTRLHPAVRLRLYRRALAGWLGTLQRLDRDHLQAMDRLVVEGKGGGSLDLPGGRIVLDSGDLWLDAQRPEGEDYEIPLTEGDPCPLPDGSLLRWESCGEAAAAASDALLLGSGLRDQPLRVRNRRPGDRLRLPGMTGRKKLQDLFVDEKVPRWRRAMQPVVLAGERILWLPGLRKAEVSCSTDPEGACWLVWEPVGPSTNAL